MALNLQMVRGNTFKFSAPITLNGVAVDLTGAIIRMTAKWSVLDSDADAVFQISTASTIAVDDPATGVIEVTVSPVLTSSLPARKIELPYDIQLVNSDGEIFTVLEGTLVILPNVTITT